ncbi:MAG: enoyl-CoA hydratase/isomerase family protein [Gemmatimonadota bacterium]|nr:enoyl-CoA hydratase/isomerase family protein [Gemmatimonadota bacterium]
MYETIRIEEPDAPVARIVLDHPPLNVLTIDMLHEISDAIESLADRPDLKALVFAGEGKAFSAGVDVEDHVDEKVRPMIAAFHGVFRRLADFEPVTVALVEGPALGGGCELAAFCDLVLASEEARFGQPEIELALFPPVSAAAFRYFVNGKKTLELMLTGEAVDAREAERIGLVNRVWPAAEFTDRAGFFLDHLAQKSAAGLRLTKKAYYAAVDEPFDEALQTVEAIYLDELMDTRDAHEGIAAFREKRKPRWKDE